MVDFAECGIRVNAILSGLIRTEGTSAANGFFGRSPYGSCRADITN